MAQEAPAPEGEKPAAEAPKADDNVDNAPVAEFKTFDADYVKQLRSEAAANRKARQEAEARITEFEERDKSELEKLTGKVTKAEERAAKAEALLLRYEVAKDKEIPAEAVDLLSGSSREDLEASAEKILNLVKSRTENEPNPDFDGGAREPAPESQTPEEEHNKNVLALLGLTPH